MEKLVADDFVEARETGRGRYQVEADVGSIFIIIDEPVALGGLGSGPTPYDLLGMALASCTTMTIRLFADRNDWPLEQVLVRVRHQRPTAGTRDQFDRELIIKGQLGSDQCSRLLEIADRCPVHKTLDRGADVRTTLSHNQASSGSAVQSGSNASSGNGTGHPVANKPAPCPDELPVAFSAPS